MRERFLDVNVFPGAYRGERDRRMSVIRGSDDNPFDVFLVLEHFAEIAVAGGARIRREHFGGVVRIDVAERDDVFARTSADVVLAHTTNSNTRDIQFFARW